MGFCIKNGEIHDDDNNSVDFTSVAGSVETGEEFHVEVVGPTSAELDSFNELIRFDHMYYKTPSPSVVQSDYAAAAQSTVSQIITPHTELDQNYRTALFSDTAASDPNLSTSSQDSDYYSSSLGSIDSSDDRNNNNNNIFSEDLLSLPGLSEADLAELTEDLERLIDPEFLWTSRIASEPLSTVSNNEDAFEEFHHKKNKQIGGPNLDLLAANTDPAQLKKCQSPWSTSSSSAFDSDYHSNGSPLSNTSGLFNDTDFDSMYNSSWEESYTDLFPALI